jgi:transmembrane sensor
MIYSKQLLTAIENYLNHTATEEERQYVNEWYHSFDDSKLVINTHEKDLKNKIDRQLRERLAGTTGLRSITKKPARIILMTPVRQWAAAVLILFGTGMGFYLYTQKDNSLEQASVFKNDILPGINNAVLTLANGRRINLTNAADGKIAGGPGITITKTKTGELIYTIMNRKHDALAPEYNTLSTAKGEQYHVILQDGSSVWLNAASSIKFPSSFSGLSKREVTLSGEAYFEVAKVMIKDDASGKAESHMPFIVHTENQKVTVLGTHFNINSYPDESITKTTLLEGSVMINDHTLLKPNEAASNWGAGISIAKVDTEDAIDWKNGDFVFKETDFKSAMRKISRWYNAEVVYDSSVPADIELGGWISRKNNLSAVLKWIESTNNVHFKVEGRRITVLR